MGVPSGFAAEARREVVSRSAGLRRADVDRDRLTVVERDRRRVLRERGWRARRLLLNPRVHRLTRAHDRRRRVGGIDRLAPYGEEVTERERGPEFGDRGLD